MDLTKKIERMRELSWKADLYVACKHIATSMEAQEGIPDDALMVLIGQFSDYGFERLGWARRSEDTQYSRRWMIRVTPPDDGMKWQEIFVRVEEPRGLADPFDIA